MANTYSDLTEATGSDGTRATGVAANYMKAAAATALGTRALRFVKVTAVHNSAAVDFGKAVLAGTGVYTASGSIWSKAIFALTGYGEVYTFFAPGTAGFIVAIADDTVNDSDTNTNVPGGYGDMEADIKAACGIDTSVTIAAVAIAGTGITIS